jgi:hypothetical protein
VRNVELRTRVCRTGAVAALHGELDTRDVPGPRAVGRPWTLHWLRARIGLGG